MFYVGFKGDAVSRKQLIDVMNKEQLIWEMVYPSILLAEPRDAWKAYANPDYPDFPQWNVVYPPDFDHVITESIKSKLLMWFERYNCPPHIYSQDKTGSISEDEYFVLDSRAARINVKDEINATFEFTEDLGLFSSLAQKTFELRESMVKDFQEKMKIIASETKAIFLLTYIDNKSVACLSAFEVAKDEYFLMNVGVLHEFRQKGLMKSMLTHLLKNYSGKFYTHSNNPVVRERATGVGFESLGVVWIKPLK